MRESTQKIMQAAAAVQFARGAVTYQAQLVARALRDGAPDARLELAALRDLQVAHRRAQLHLDHLDPSGGEFGPPGVRAVRQLAAGRHVRPLSRAVREAAPPDVGPGLPGGHPGRARPRIGSECTAGGPSLTVRAAGPIVGQPEQFTTTARQAHGRRDSRPGGRE
jgi:hypothetical protein